MCISVCASLSDSGKSPWFYSRGMALVAEPQRNPRYCPQRPQGSGGYSV